MSPESRTRLKSVECGVATKSGYFAGEPANCRAFQAGCAKLMLLMILTYTLPMYRM